jgi:hypothetical protein
MKKQNYEKALFASVSLLTLQANAQDAKCKQKFSTKGKTIINSFNEKSSYKESDSQKHSKSN